MLPVNVDEDTVQVDVTVTNVGDGLYNSFVYVDFVQEQFVDNFTSYDVAVSPPPSKLPEWVGQSLCLRRLNGLAVR